MAYFYQDAAVFVWSITVLSTFGYILGYVIRPRSDATEDDYKATWLHRYLQFPLLLFVVFHVLYGVYDRSEHTSIAWAWVVAIVVVLPQLVLPLLRNAAPEKVFTITLYFVTVSGGLYVPLSGIFDRTATLLVLGACVMLLLATLRPWLASTNSFMGKAFLGLINALESIHQSYFIVIGWWMILHDKDKNPDEFAEPPGALYWTLVVLCALFRFMFITWQRPGHLFSRLT